MNSTLNFLKKLKRLLFHKKNPAEAAGRQLPPSSKTEDTPEAPRALPTTMAPPAAVRDPYFIQIGFDFGTSYSKCICRDVIKNRAWVYLPELKDLEIPFLIPSTLQFQDEKFKQVTGSPTNIYHKDGLHHLKLALVKVALKEWDDPVLTSYKEAVGNQGPEKLEQFVRASGVYFLAGVLGNIRKDLRDRFPSFGSLPKDYMAVNLALPVADAERPAVDTFYYEILSTAWTFSDQFSGYPGIRAVELQELIQRDQKHHRLELKEACYLYPEVSANVQGLVRSPMSREGIYLFSDTGAGTVDQSVFIFTRHDGIDRLTYLHGAVLPIGSSQLEYLAAAASGRVDWQSLESWRKKKENGEDEPELLRAKSKINTKLSEGTERTLARAKKKLYSKDQLSEIRVIFGGGGHCDNPYKKGVLNPFSGNLFSKKITPPPMGSPTPKDLDLGGQEQKWMRRLSVAYGLSFTRSHLADFIYPKDVNDPKPEDIWKPLRNMSEAPTKDLC